MVMSRLKRSLELLNLLQSGHGQTVKSLANALGCSRRTIFRDIKVSSHVPALHLVDFFEEGV